ncbi:MAG: hypothetical protein GC179_15175 [Anaerolineaceae bacterium]|nr:hypothetical protein [Anaerolineaceae bacterium]
MNRRTLFILLTIFVVLIAISLLQTRQSSAPASETTPDPSNMPTTDASQVLSDYTFMGQTLGMNMEDITAIRLRDPVTKKTFTLSRDSAGNWTAPDNPGTLDLNTATNIAKTVVLLPYESTIEVKPDTKLSDFGFRPDGVFAIEILLRGDKAHAVTIGDLNTSETSYYGLVDDKKVIYVMERRAIDYLWVQLRNPPVT